MFNKAILIGRLGRDAEVKYTRGGSAFATFTLATSEKTQGEEKTEWHQIVLMGKGTEGVAPYLLKGTLVCVEGKIQYRQWEDKQGTKRTQTEILAWNVKLLGGGQKPAAPQPKPADDEDIPF